MEVPFRTSAEEHRKYFPGKMIHLGEGPAWQDILVEIHHRNPVEQTLLIPAVAEPQLIWQISGHLLCSDRDLGGEWSTHEVVPGDLFLTASSEPYELKWKAISKRFKGQTYNACVRPKTPDLPTNPPPPPSFRSRHR